LVTIDAKQNSNGSKGGITPTIQETWKSTSEKGGSRDQRQSGKDERWRGRLEGIQ